jgi:hypothetical protein
MKKFVFFFLVFGFICSSVHSLSGQTAYYKQMTHYYKQTKKVIDGRESVGDNSGQFITINEKGCYDSDKNGYTVGNGFLEYLRKDKDIQIYYGSSYWGRAYYYFSSDYSRVNVKTSDEVIYVYEKRPVPNGVTTCSLTKESSKTYPVPAPSPYPTPLPTPNPTPNPTPKSDYEYVSCPQCSGSGNCSGCHGSGLSNITYTSNRHVCTNCRGGGRCSSCNGTGKVYRRVR